MTIHISKNDFDFDGTVRCSRFSGTLRFSLTQKFNPICPLLKHERFISSRIEIYDITNVNTGNILITLSLMSYDNDGLITPLPTHSQSHNGKIFHFLGAEETSGYLEPYEHTNGRNYEEFKHLLASPPPDSEHLKLGLALFTNLVAPQTDVTASFSITNFYLV